MNKYKEALDEIKNIVLDESGDGYRTAKYLQNFYYSSCETLQELVDKETPKKPIDIEFGPCGDLMLCCPTCKHGVVPIPTYHGNKYYPRCPFCGQKLREEDKDDC